MFFSGSVPHMQTLSLEIRFNNQTHIESQLLRFFFVFFFQKSVIFTSVLSFLSLHVLCVFMVMSCAMKGNTNLNVMHLSSSSI